ncbi:MAG TPA: TraR/DksA family transcriptional regulator, partial [Pirellulaceae bacterium]|nr:TraR/DksA family transcriptional regulator [Pirellulaceae bacterium]
MARKDALQRIRNQLVARREALRQTLAGDDSLLRQLNQSSGSDVIDFASDSANGEISSQLAEVATRELANIEWALKFMSAGKYGKCEACNANIPLARLEALPYATLCIDCQRELEAQRRDGRISPDWSKILERPTDDLRITDL